MVKKIIIFLIFISIGLLFASQKDETTDINKLAFNNSYISIKNTGVALTFSGAGLLTLGAAGVGISYYFLWVAIVTYLNTYDFTIVDWSAAWHAMYFLANQNVYAALAITSLTLGIAFIAIGAILIPGIILLSFGSYKSKKNKISNYNLYPINNGVCIAFKIG